MISRKRTTKPPARIKVVVPISGGKDSQACLKLALEQYQPHEVRGLFCDVGFDHPLTYTHIEKLRTLYGQVQIDTVCGGTVLEMVQKYKGFPVGGSRFCTEELKIWQSKKYYRQLANNQAAGFEVWLGMRSQESPARKKRYAGKVGGEVYAPHDVLRKYPKYLAKAGVTFRLAVLDWSTAEIFYFLDGEENPLYAAGFDRVGCFPCLGSGDAWKEKAFAFDTFGREQREKVQATEKIVGKSVWQSKGGLSRNTAQLLCSFCAE